jgi:hypothetical protein
MYNREEMGSDGGGVLMGYTRVVMRWSRWITSIDMSKRVRLCQSEFVYVYTNTVAVDGG